jgi:hypothetical protein
VRTDAPTRTWMDAILRKVARRCHNAGEPPLTSLCVKRNLKVSDSYKYVLELAALPVPADIETHAAYARWACYAAHGADVPVDGGTPPLISRGGSARRSSGSVATRPAPAKADTGSRTVVCSSCFIQLPATGICEHC